MSLSLDDFITEQCRTMVKLDDWFGPMPEMLSPMHARNLSVLARFGLAEEAERRLTERGQRLVDEEEIE